MGKITPLLIRLSIWLLGVLGFMLLGYVLLPARLAPLPFLAPVYQSNFLLWAWANFDGEHYIRIASSGYQVIMGQSQFAFFPLFPLLIRILGTLLGGDYYLASHALVSAATLGFAYYLLAWTKLRLHGEWSVLTPTILFPGSIFLLSIYTEPLFLLLVILTFLASERKQWGRAALYTALATATRVNGLFLVLFLITQAWGKMSLKRLFALVVVSSSGLLAYMTYLYATTGSALAFLEAQSGWGKSTLTMPWVTAGRYLTALTTAWSFDLTHLVVVVEVLVTLYLVILLFFVIKKRLLTLPYLLYCAGNLVLPIATGSLGSMPRFGLLLFPLFVALPSFPRPWRAILYLVSGALAGVGIILFTRGYWWA